MKYYRAYCFDGGSRITNADWIEAEDDAEALRAAKGAYDCFRIEVWDRDRLAGRHQRASLSRDPDLAMSVFYSVQ